jgi:hypothetical protein
MQGTRYAKPNLHAGQLKPLHSCQATAAITLYAVRGRLIPFADNNIVRSELFELLKGLKFDVMVYR